MERGGPTGHHMAMPDTVDGGELAAEFLHLTSEPIEEGLLVERFLEFLEFLIVEAGSAGDHRCGANLRSSVNGKLVHGVFPRADDDG